MLHQEGEIVCRSEHPFICDADEVYTSAFIGFLKIFDDGANVGTIRQARSDAVYIERFGRREQQRLRHAHELRVFRCVARKLDDVLRSIVFRRSLFLRRLGFRTLFSVLVWFLLVG